MEILSKEMIKPSSSTPQHLHKHNLSFLHQTHALLIFFYELSPTDEYSTISQNLKRSLSQVLTRYYPLAGRIIVDGQGIEPPYVDCNDAGVEFVETRVHARMSDVATTEGPNPDALPKYGRIGKIIIPLFIQSNLFDCGGVALAVSISHDIADVATIASFMNDWSATCRQQGHQLGPGPDFGFLSSHFPARASPPPRVAMKRFVFGKEMLSELKRVGPGPEETNLGRVECVTAFIWGGTRFPVFEVDYGWGKPRWVATVGGVPLKSLAVFMDTKNGDGVEAWVSMVDEVDMALFEANYKRLCTKLLARPLRTRVYRLRPTINWGSKL